MNYQANLFNPQSDTCDCLVIGIDDSKQLPPHLETLDQDYQKSINNLLNAGDFAGNLEEITVVHQLDKPIKRVCLVGLGDASRLTEQSLQKITSAVFYQLKSLAVQTTVFDFIHCAIPQRDLQDKIKFCILQIEALSYQFDQFKTKKASPLNLKTIIFPIMHQDELKSLEETIHFAKACAAGMDLTKTLGNLPSNICTPTYLAETAQELAKAYANLQVTVLDEKALTEQGFNTLLAVAKGSQEPPRLVALEYKGDSSNQAPIALVGKGITFDTGGIWLKPAEGMDEMKYDMLGAATVLGVIKAAAELKLPINVVGVIACAENMPSGTATKPADVVTSLSGQTVEIINTDAEGRLVLCDALTYTKKFNPSKVIDIATLTGAIIIALGPYATGLFSNNNELAKQLIKAGKKANDLVWQMPLVEEYQPRLDSRFADMMNVSGDRVAGSIIAACFLARFTQEFQWAHLDIAATGWVSGRDKGASGRPVPLLLEFLVQQANTH